MTAASFYLNNRGWMPPRGPAAGGSGSSQGSPHVKKKRGRPRKYAPDLTATLAVKKKRGRPRKYPPDGNNTSSGLKRNRVRGRPSGSGWKQQLATLGEWMNNSAGRAFTPHIIRVAVGEDVAAKILSFAQKRPRGLCVLSASGSLSSFTTRADSGGAVTYEGRYEIVCLSGNYLLDEAGGPCDRTGGISISVCSPESHVIGGAVGGRLTAATPVQVIACSFVYGIGGKTKRKKKKKKKRKKKSKPEASENGENRTTEQAEKSSITSPAAAGHDQARDSATGILPPDSRSSQMVIDRTSV